jgi:hypothetical protein
MNLSELLAGAVQNPGQQANPTDMTTMLGVVQQLSQRAGTDPGTIQQLLSTVGTHVRDALAEKQSAQGEGEAQAIVAAHQGTEPDPQAVERLFSPEAQQRVTQDAGARTGLNPQVIAGLLPVVVPLILKLLHGGASTQGGGNPLLSSLLGSGQQGQMDVGNALNLVSTFFGNR